MEPASLAASIAGLVSLTDTLFRLLCQYSREVKDAKKEIDQLAIETRQLSMICHDLSLVAISLENDPLDSSFRLEHVDSCERLLAGIKAKLDKSLGGVHSTSTIKSTVAKFKWPFSKKELQTLFADLSRHKENLSMALSADSMKALLQLLSGFDDIKESIRDIKTRIFVDDKRENILEFFLTVNPQANLDTSIQLRHPMTGLWLTEGKEFQSWLSGMNSKLWMSGIPGAGKTVLAGSVIQESLRVAFQTVNMGACFFFCDYKDAKSHEVVKIFSSFASQLARQSDEAYSILEGYHSELNPRQSLPQSPQIPRLREVLLKILQQFDRVLAVVDGLDECGFKSDVPIALSNLVLECPTLSLALLSRDEIHIREVLESDFVHIDIAAQNADVRRYVREELEERVKHRRLRIRNVALKEDIINTLIDKAGGMFRWVSCQLDYLCELPSDKARREALGRLPPTLNATYERILLRNIHDSVSNIVRRTLMLVAAVGPRITITQLCDAVSVSDDLSKLEVDDPVLEEDVLRYCSSLLRRSSDQERLEFAHFSVQEFLESSSLLDTPIAEYYIGPDNMIDVIGHCLRFLLMDDFNITLTSPTTTEHRLTEVFQAHPFYQFAAANWPVLDQEFLRWAPDEESYMENETFQRALSLFQPAEQVYFKMWAATFLNALIHLMAYTFSQSVDEIRQGVFEDILDGTISPIKIACVSGLSYLVTCLVAGTPDILAQGTVPPWECLVYGFPRLVRCRIAYIGYYDDFSRLPYGLASPEERVNAVLAISNTHNNLPQQKRLQKANMEVFRLLTQYHRSSSLALIQKLSSLVQVGFCPDLALIRDLAKSIRDGLMEETERDNAVRELNQAAEHFGKTCDDQDQVQNVRATLAESVSILKSLGKYSKTEKPEELDDLSFELKLLKYIEEDDIVSLERFARDARFNQVITRGIKESPLLHLAARNTSLRCLQWLLQIGCDDSVIDSLGDTVWHVAAERFIPDSCKAINALIEISPNPEARQRDLDVFGNTPIRGAVLERNYEIAERLWPCCDSEDCIAGTPSLLKLALEDGTSGMDWIKSIAPSKLFKRYFKLDYSILHELSECSDVSAVKGLFSLLPDSRENRQKGRLPVEQFLKATTYFDYEDTERCIIHQILPSSNTMRLEVFDFACQDLIPSLLRWPRANLANRMRSFLELYADFPALPKQSLVNALCLPIGLPSPGLCVLSRLDEALYRVLTSSTNSGALLDLKGLIHVAVYCGWKEICGLILLGEVDVLDLLQGRSALEVACLPGSVCSEDTFVKLLDKVGQTRPNSCAPSLLFNLIEGKQDVPKLQLILNRGMDLCIEHPVSGEPLVIYHLVHGSVETSMLLLKYGASHQTCCARSGFNVLCGLIWNDQIDEVRDFKDKYPRTDWNMTCSLSSRWSPNSDFWIRLGVDELTDCKLVHIAALRGSVKCLRYLIDEGLVSDVNATTAEGYTPAHLLVAAGNNQVFRAIMYLRNKGCNFEALTPSSETPLDLAIKCRASQIIMKNFIEMSIKGSNPDCFSQRSLSTVCNLLRDARHLYSRKAVQEAMLCALKDAIETSDLDACKGLQNLSCPLDAPLPTPEGCLPLIYALACKQSEVVLWLLETNMWGTAPELVMSDQNPIALAVSDSSMNPALDRLLWSFKSQWPKWMYGEKSLSPIVKAVEATNLEGLKIILNFIELRSTQKVDPMPNVCCILRKTEDHMALHEAARQGSIPIIEILLKHGADVEARDSLGRTPLWHAMDSKQRESLEFLLKRGASSQWPANGIPSLLHMAVQVGNLDCLRIVASYCKDVDISKIPLGYPSPSPFSGGRDCLQYLLQHGFDPTTKDEIGIPSLHHLLGEESLQMYILQTGLLQSTGLHEQCVNLHLLPDTTSSNIIGFIPRIRRALGTESTLKMFPLTTGPLKSALCIAAAIGDTHCCQEYISMGADLEAIGHPLGSPLAVAIYHKHFDLAKYLIRMGAKITNRGREGSYMLSPFQYAVQHPRFYRWILIERYTDQRKICPIEHNTEKLSQDFKPWSCSRKARVPLVVKRARRSDESSFDYLVRLVEMKRDFLGELVDY